VLEPFLSNTAIPDHRWSSSFRLSSFRFLLAVKEVKRRGRLLVFQGSWRFQAQEESDMPLVEQPVIARTDQHDRPINAAACASKHLWNAANSPFADVTSLVSGLCVRLSGPRSTQRRTETLVQEWKASDATG
jgi:hypothetical protein